MSNTTQRNSQEVSLSGERAAASAVVFCKESQDTGLVPEKCLEVVNSALVCMNYYIIQNNCCLAT